MTSGTAAFKRIVDLLEKWPVDKSKTGRDLGQYLRDTYNRAYRENKFEANHSYWDRQYFALQRIINSDHKNKYVRVLPSSATGLNAEQCREAISNEVLEELKEEESKSKLKKILPFKFK